MPEHVPGHFFALFLPRHVLQHLPGQNIGLFLPWHVLGGENKAALPG